VTSLLVLPAWTVVLGVLCIVALATTTVVTGRALRGVRARTALVADTAARDAEALRAQLGELEEQLAVLRRGADRRDGATPVVDGTVVADREYLITGLGSPRRSPLPAVPALPAPEFADLVLRESLVRAAALAAGLRHALAPEVRHRIRAEMKREVKRSRRQRRADLRQARREWEARQRAALDAA
jgi:hypothetical protein